MNMNPPKNWKLYESAYIKSIRRRLLDDAIYWCIALIKSGKINNIWRRIFIHLSEDIGIAEPYLPATIYALYQSYLILQKEEKAAFESDCSPYLPILHATALLVTAKKSRAIDHALTLFLKNKQPTRKIPNYAMDFHSPKGRRLGKDSKHFLTVGARTDEVTETLIKWQTEYSKLLNHVEEKPCLNIMR